MYGLQHGSLHQQLFDVVLNRRDLTAQLSRLSGGHTSSNHSTRDVASTPKGGFRRNKYIGDVLEHTGI